jgi:uncharacterized protein
LILSEPIIAEFTRTLRKPYFRARVNEDQIAAALALLGTEAKITSLTIVVTGVAAHPEDDLVLATAVSAHADYLVTGDTGLLHVGNYEGVQILSPRALLDLLRDKPSG